MIKGIIDIDDVVSDWYGWVRDQMAEDPKLSRTDRITLESMWDLTPEEANEIVQDLRGYSEAEIVPGAFAGLWWLERHPDVDFIYLSAAPKQAQGVRMEWMKRMGLPNNRPLTHVGDRDGKVAWVLEHGFDYQFIVDDGLSYLDAALLSGIELRMLYDHLWNQGDEGNHIRVKSWAGVGYLISKFLKGETE